MAPAPARALNISSHYALTSADRSPVPTIHLEHPSWEAYGLTEAAHQVASNPLPPRPHKPGGRVLHRGRARAADLVHVSDEGGPIVGRYES